MSSGRRLDLRQRLRSVARPPSEWWGVALLSVEPLIVASTIGLKRMPLFSAMPPSLAQEPCHFLLGMGWTADNDDVAGGFIRVCLRHLETHPCHRIALLCNEPGAVSRLRAGGVEAALIHQNAFADEHIFRPLPERPHLYDAVYNARFVAWKRHHLASDIDRLALIGYTTRDDPAGLAAYLSELRAVLPQASYANGWQRGQARRLRSEQVNGVLNEAGVGLCLSGAEGAMLASVEYLLSGLPIVSTPSLGGRDAFFDPEFCTVVDPDPRLIREAVGALIERNIPREHIRAKTLARIEPVRRAFVDLVQGIYDDQGAGRRFADEWPAIRSHRLIDWVPVVDFWRRVERLRGTPAGRPPGR